MVEEYEMLIRKKPQKNKEKEKLKKIKRYFFLKSLQTLALGFLDRMIIRIQDEIEREARKKKKLENAKNTVEGRHGGKHYFEDEDYIKSKKETTGRDKHIIQMFNVRLEF